MTYLHTQIAALCNQQGNKLSSVNLSNLKRGAVQGEVNARVSKILNDLVGKVNNQILSEFRNKVQSSVEANAKSIDKKLASLSDNVDETLQIAGADYIKQLELELKDKEATEKKISTALSKLEQFKKSFNI